MLPSKLTPTVRACLNQVRRASSRFPYLAPRLLSIRAEECGIPFYSARFETMLLSVEGGSSRSLAMPTLFCAGCLPTAFSTCPAFLKGKRLLLVRRHQGMTKMVYGASCPGNKCTPNPPGQRGRVRVARAGSGCQAATYQSGTFSQLQRSSGDFNTWDSMRAALGLDKNNIAAGKTQHRGT